MVCNMKNKKCVQCNKTISYEEWAECSLNPNKGSWERKKYCSTKCIRAGYNDRRKKKINEKYGIHNSS